MDFKYIVYVVAKAIQAFALVILLVGLITSFPRLMNPRLFLVSLSFFLCGWLIQKTIQK